MRAHANIHGVTRILIQGHREIVERSIGRNRNPKALGQLNRGSAGDQAEQTPIKMNFPAKSRVVLLGRCAVFGESEIGMAEIFRRDLRLRFCIDDCRVDAGEPHEMLNW